MTPALGTYVSSVGLGPILPMPVAGAGLGSFVDRRLTWAATMTKSHWAPAPVGTGEAHMGVEGRRNNGTSCNLPFLCSPYLLRSGAPPTQFLLCAPPPPAPQHKRSDGPGKGRADWHIEW